MKKYKIEVRDRETSEVFEIIERVARSEQIGNFNLIFCTYKGNKRCLVKSDAGDLSDPFRRGEVYAESLYIEYTTYADNTMKG